MITNTYGQGQNLTQISTELSNLIKEKIATNMSRTVLVQFKSIVQNIFGSECDDGTTTHTGGWQLGRLTKSSNPMDYDAAVSFLHPDGALFALIKSLMTETSAKFEFPVSEFPPSLRLMIENGTAPPFFANKIISNNYISVSHMILNAFEFYIFNFGLYILKNNSSFELPNLVDEPAYFTLLRLYLDNLVPVEEAVRTTINVAQQSTKPTNVLNLAASNYTSSPPSLFKGSVFKPNIPMSESFSYNTNSSQGYLVYAQGANLDSIEWRCNTFLLLLTELWFGNIPVPKTNYILRGTTQDDNQPYSANIDQMTAVRIVIKHLHGFANSITYSPMTYVNNQGLAEIKQAIWTSKYPLQKRLYHFIKVAFHRWPLDYTFRQPLEAWLSFIQPWRYLKLDLEGGGREKTLIDVPCFDNNWRNFMANNLAYYTVIFSLFVKRLLKLDLSSSRNALMLFRVMKVYSQPGFLLLLREAEELVTRNKPTILASNGRTSTPKAKIVHLENSEGEYVSIFSLEVKQQLKELLVEIHKSHLSIQEFVHQLEERSKLRNRSWFESFKAFITMNSEGCFESRDELDMYKDKLQAEEHLNFAINKITQHFEVAMPEMDIHERSSFHPTSSKGVFFNV